MDMNSFIVHVKLEDIYADLFEDIEIRFYTSNYEVERPLPMGKNEKVKAIIEFKLGGKIMKQTLVLKHKMFSYLASDDHNDKKTNGRKKCVIKLEFKF